MWAEGAFFCLGVPPVLFHLIERSGSYQSIDEKFVILEAVIYGCLGYLFVAGAAAITAAHALEHNRIWAPRALRIASCLNLPVVPLGTVLGGFGLWLAGRPKAQTLLVAEGPAIDESSGMKKSGSWLERTSLFVQITASLFLIPLTAKYLNDQGTRTLGYWGFIAACMLAALLGILCHELGHVIAGVISGFHFQTLSAGPLVVSKLSDGWRFQWVNSVGLWNGMTVMSPGSPKRLRSNAVFFVLGGPLGSAVCGTVSLALLAAGPSLHLGVIAEFFGILGVIEIVNSMANLVPLRVTGGFTDGARLIQLIRKDQEGVRFLAGLAFGLSDTTTLRPKDWHPKWIESVTEDPKSPTFSRGCYHAYVYHLDRGEMAEAGVWLARCMDSHQALKRDPFRWILAIENAFFEARHLQNPVGAKEWLKVPRVGIPAERFRLLRVKAAIHVAEGERELAARAIGDALRLHAQSAGTGRQQFERAVLRDLQNWFDELTGATSLSRLAQALRERDTVIAAAKALEAPTTPVHAIQRFLRPQP